MLVVVVVLDLENGSLVMGAAAMLACVLAVAWRSQRSVMQAWLLFMLAVIDEPSNLDLYVYAGGGVGWPASGMTPPCLIRTLKNS